MSYPIIAFPLDLSQTGWQNKIYPDKIYPDKIYVDKIYPGKIYPDKIYSELMTRLREKVSLKEMIVY